MDRNILDRHFAASPAPYRVEKATELATDESEDRTIRFVASDETVDRYGDVVSAKGWELADFKKNPIFLWMHSYTDPIGRVVKIGVEDSKLMATVKFASEGVSDLADNLWALVKEKILRAVSVGFMVDSEDDYEYIRDEDEKITGIHFLRQQLLELSLVSVPANPAALSVARSLLGARSIQIPQKLVNEALYMDASVRARNDVVRRRVQALRMAGLKYSAPR